MPTPLIARRLLGGGNTSLGDRAAQFSGTTKLSVPNTGDFSPASQVPWTVAFWFAMDQDNGADAWEVLNVAGAAVGSDGWFTYVEGTTRRLAMGYSNGTSYSFFAPAGAALSTSTWYFAICHWTQHPVTPLLLMDLWTTSAGPGSFSTSGSGQINVSTQPLNIGGGVGGQVWSRARLDKVGIWNRAFSGGEGPALWNNGLGLTGSELASVGLTSGLVDYYDLDQRSGTATWTSLSGSNNATATGNVISVPRAGLF